MAGTAEYGMQRIAETALEPVAAQTAVVFQVTDRWFDGTSPMDRLLDRPRDTTLLATEPVPFAYSFDRLLTHHRQCCRACVRLSFVCFS